MGEEPTAPIEEVLARHSEGWRELDGVEGMGIGLCDDTPCIRVFASRAADELRRIIPERVEGHRVDIEPTEGFTSRD